MFATSSVTRKIFGVIAPPPLLVRGGLFDQLEPSQGDGHEPLALEAIENAAPLAPNRDQTRLLQHAQMPRGGGPAMAEARGEIARGQLAAEVAQDQEDAPPRLVGEGAEHGFAVRE